MTSAIRKHSVIFVCYGNICRSTMAEAIFKDLISKKNLTDQWIVDSAGTGDHERGSPLYSRAQKALNKHGIKSEHRARQIRADDYEKFDFILGFDRDNIEEIEAMKPKTSKSVVKLINFYNPKEKNKEIADPWGYGDDTFERVFKSCNDACEGFLKEIYGDS